MKKSLAIFAIAAISLVVVAVGQAGAAVRHAVPAKTVTVAMHDPGCHWFSVGGKLKSKLAVKGPISLYNLDEATIKVVGAHSFSKFTAVGKKLTLARGAYSITMVGQHSDDNVLKLIVS